MTLREQADAVAAEAETKAAEAETKAAEAETKSTEAQLMTQVAEKLSEAADLEEGKIPVTSVTGKRGRPAGKKDTEKAAAKKAAAKKGSPRGKSMKEAVVSVLKGKKKGLLLPQIVVAVLSNGYETTAAEPTNVVYQAIYKLMREEKTVEKTPENCYRLKAAA